MNKIANVVYSGWMVKSPPEKKFRLTGAWKIFRARWKKRFFVLFKPEGSLPHQYVLNYYSDENCKRLKGVIDLEHCEQIIESLDLELYPFLLAIKTFHKNKERTYFLATDTEEQMTTWVRNLCSVCGLKPEENPTTDDIPPPVTENPRTSFSSSPDNPQPKPVLAVAPITTQPTIPESMVRQDSLEDYIPLSNCSSGKKRTPNRQDSVDSIPDEHAPPPPVKEGHTDIDNDVFHPSTYDTPKRLERVIDSIYKVPPPRVITPDQNNAQDTYDVPPPTHHSPSSPRSSSSDSQKVDSAYSSQTGLPSYDYPPHSGDQLGHDDVYDVPPSNHPSVPGMGDVPPRPPPPKSYNQEPYQNLPNNSRISNFDLDKVVPTSAMDKHCSIGSYDIPPPKLTYYERPKGTIANGDVKGVSPNSVPPPPQRCSAGVSHSYINAGKGYVQPRVDGENNYLPMEGNKSRNNSDSVYHDMSGGHDPYLDMTPGHHEVYDKPPARPPRVSPRPSTNQEQDTYSIFSTSRTRSFKRHPSSSSSQGTLEKRSNQTAPPLPSPLRIHPDMETSSEEDEDYLVDPKQVMMPYYCSEQRSKGWEDIPPAPKQDSELKYLDLALDNPYNDHETHRLNAPPPGQSTPTEYKEIDFVKTIGLQELKSKVQNDRKHDEA
ncbi:GRB2-associated-binding protein 1-like isoform X2 [Saccostrea echinata]|uniref:GRB2-associated-binding protein 1-like isoform X2 n=1 Tax=Saccostrea echinata TaxID=191078 RepID=UPI002A7F1BEE|nr:GRB2-associated-binding protein 1-like isoform X2 [Saccostrea echinata]